MSSQKLLRRRALLVFASIAAFAAPAVAQVSEPEFVPYVNDLQIFDQPDLSKYGQGQHRPEGWFGSAEYLSWSQIAPRLALVGAPGAIPVFNPGTSTTNSGNLTTAVFIDRLAVTITSINQITGTVTVNTNILQSYPSTRITGGIPSAVVTQSGTIISGGLFQSSTLDTTYMSTPDFTSGGRYEFGRMVGGRGFIISGFNWGTSVQSADVTNVAVNFQNSPAGFVDVRSTTALVPDGFDDDLDGDGVYGRFGRDRGTPTTVNGIVMYTGTLDGVPDPEPAGTPVPIDFDDAVALPSRFAFLHIENRTAVYSFEAMGMWEVCVGPHGGVWEAFAGPRGIQLNDQFLFNGSTGINTAFATYFDTNARNYILGGQVGGRWSREKGRWQLGAEGRFLAAANVQHVTQEGQVGDPGTGTGIGTATNVLIPSQFSSRANQTEFSPAAELRLNLKYYLFRSFFVQAGYSALFVDNIARGAPMTIYRLPQMGINEGRNDSSFFVHGVNIGVVFNR